MSKIEAQSVHVHGDEMYDPSLSAGKLPNDDSAPPYGVPLTDETVKLVKLGDFVRRINYDNAGVKVGEVFSIFGLEEGEYKDWIRRSEDISDVHDYINIAFIARADPANPGWYLAPEGGFPENPVPGEWVYTVGIDGTEFPLHRSTIAHWQHPQFRVARFRIVDEPATEQPVQPKETVEDVDSLKSGERVRVTFEGTFRNGYLYTDDGIAIFNEGFLKMRATSIEVLPPAAKPLKVGEVVMCGSHSSTVKVISGPQVCIIYDTGSIAIRPIHELSRPCGTPIAESE